MYRIAVCDDNEKFLKDLILNLTSYLEKEGLCYEIVEYQAGLALLSDIESKRLYDIYILDIEMPVYSGIDITRVIAQYDPAPLIIFVTSYLKYAVDSFDYNIFRFIPKTELKDRLAFALKAAFSKLDEQRDRYYFISNNRRFEKISYKEILYIYKDGKNSVFVLPELEVKVRKTLETVYKELGGEDFIFIDRCTIINLQSIKEIDCKMAKIKVKNGREIDVARIRIQDLKKELNSYWGKHI
ncbi:LytTR family DNA-binding domain-containing protein [Hungatella sp.]|uniref:LytR/AlgR family response regulator transcription factor n=1 Tax=Hungatella sp. TaxID=2613924 RepID=UPI002A8035A0|nr:LytTR family DNA-binding domain-containing protein [Hungatella sp.]